MAARENQGLQIALIVCAMLIVGLGVFTFILYNNSKDEALKTAAAQKDSKTDRDALMKSVEEMNQLKLLMGYAARDEASAIQANFKKDVETYAASMRESEQNYRNIVSQLSTELQKQSELVVEAQKRNDQLQSEFKNKEASNANEIEQYKSGLKQAKDDLEQERSKFNDERNKIKGQMAEASRKFDDKTKKFDEDVAKGTKDLGEREDQLRDTMKQLAKVVQVIKEQELSTERADGKVTWVDQGARLVWLNLGSSDGVRRQVSFSVIAQNEINPIRAEKKGTVEVVRILKDHLSEARIMDDDPSKPIMPGDQLFSAAWQPNRAEHFALVGLMDLDKDGENDVQKIVDLITVNGGIVDAVLKDDGTREGKMNVDTHYLVQGEKPNEKSNKSAEYLKNYSAMIEESKLLPIKIIRLGDLIAYLGYKDREKAVPLGSDAKPSDFPPRPPNEIPRRWDNGMFKPRRNTPSGKNDVVY
ncbi:MAG TPA: hypothetical protein VMF30_03030 [Pirellulales bacterium]|nr:hypothetical protein [Pirellulales bacterium]